MPTKYRVWIVDPSTGEDVGQAVGETYDEARRRADDYQEFRRNDY